MISIRLPSTLEEKLNLISERERITKSEIIRRALEEYLEEYEKLKSAYELGEDLFGKYGSGIGTLSIDYKKRVREKIHAKMSH